MFILQFLPVQIPAILVINPGGQLPPLCRRQKAVFTPFGKRKFAHAQFWKRSRRLARRFSPAGNLGEGG
jgi:hypothetical protein